jgi:hypothetical protein
MDLSTVKKHLKGKSHYTSLDLVFKDIQQIWDNCKKFNQEGSTIYDQAVNMEKKTKDYIKHLFSSHTAFNLGKSNPSLMPQQTTNENKKKTMTLEKSESTSKLLSNNKNTQSLVTKDIREMSLKENKANSPVSQRSNNVKSETRDEDSEQ